MDFQSLLASLNNRTASRLKKAFKKAIKHGLGWVEGDVAELYEEIKNQVPIEKADFYEIFIKAYDKAIIKEMEKATKELIKQSKKGVKYEFSDLFR